MGLPRELTTVTRVSKAVTLLMFIALPIIAFIFGVNYEKEKMFYQNASLQNEQNTKPSVTTSPSTGEVTSWKDYTSETDRFTLKYPSNWSDLRYLDNKHSTVPKNDEITNYNAQSVKMYSKNGLVSGTDYFRIELITAEEFINRLGNLTLLQYASNEMKIAFVDVSSYQLIPLTIDSFPAVEVRNIQTNLPIRTYIQFNTKVYEIRVYVDSTETSKKGISNFNEMYKQIIDSIHFIPSSPPDVKSNEPEHIGTYKGIPIHP